MSEKNKSNDDYDRSIHSNPDAMAWTKFFRECNPNCNVSDETMLGWFANAMMAMHDHVFNNELNSILMRCASMRGVSRLPHRILHEFDWFVSAIIWHEWDKYPDREEYQALKKFKSRTEFGNDLDALTEWAKLFLEYCTEQYGDWRKTQEAELKELLNIMKGA